jgi:hypothetical protein
MMQMSFGSGRYKDETGIIAKVLTLRYSENAKSPARSMQRLSRAIFLSRQQTTEQIFKELDKIAKTGKYPEKVFDWDEYEILKARFLFGVNAKVSSSPLPVSQPTIPRPEDSRLYNV